ncbi:MAG: MBL fold metallo-hydrolase [Candidatus Korobacteraceae bacterium]
MIAIDTILGGFPGWTSRGALGWGAIYLVTTETGEKILFDTGATNQRSSLLPKLKERGISPANISTVILSHLHFDHASNWDYFIGSEIVVHASDLEWALSAHGPVSELAFRCKAIKEHAKLRVITEDCELKPGLRIIHVPGHTPGSIALKMDRIVICGDALKNRWELQGDVPTVPASSGPKSLWSAQAFIKSLEKLTSGADKLYPGHDSPMLRTSSGWEPQGDPTVGLFFPNGQSQELKFVEDKRLVAHS